MTTKYPFIPVRRRDINDNTFTKRDLDLITNNIDWSKIIEWLQEHVFKYPFAPKEEDFINQANKQLEDLGNSIFEFLKAVDKDPCLIKPT